MRINFKQLLEEHAVILIIFFCAIIIILKIILSLNFYAPFIYPDEIYYDGFASNLKSGLFYGDAGISFPPGYPIFLSLAYWISNDKNAIYHIMLVISAIITTMIIFPSFFILKKYCNALISILGAVTITILPLMNFYSFTIMTEVLFIPLFLLSIWFLLNSYETNDKKWEILASLSVVYLYITRSNGISMLAAFVLSFTYYIIINKKYNNVINLIKKKSVLIGSFIIFLSLWIIFSTYVTDINILLGHHEIEKSHSTFGSSYNFFAIFWQALSGLFSISGLSIIIGCLIYLINYLFLSSYFLLFVAIVYLSILYLNNKIEIDTPEIITLVYLFTTISLLIFSTLFYTFDVGDILLGRYLDPIIPPIIVLSIICIYKMNTNIMSKKYIDILVFSFILFVLLVMSILMYNSTIILSLLKFVNNPALYQYTTFYDPFFGINYGQALYMPTWNIPSGALIITYLLTLLTLIYLSIKDKRYLVILLLILVISASVFSVSGYYNELFSSRMSNRVIFANTYIENNTTQNIIDVLNNTDLQQIKLLKLK